MAQQHPNALELEVLSDGGKPVVAVLVDPTECPILFFWRQGAELWLGSPPPRQPLFGPVDADVEELLDSVYPGICELARMALGVHDCLAEGQLRFVAHYAAPGIGQAWECTTCWKQWSKVGGSFFDPRARVHELRPEDVR